MIIEKGIVPPPVKKLSILLTMARRMEVGDSIFVTDQQRGGAASNMGRVTGFTFTQRKEGEGLRIWRIK